MSVIDQATVPEDALPDADGRTFGWEPPSAEAERELLQRYPDRPEHLFVLKRRVDLRPTCPPVYDQVPFNTCTANAVSGMIHAHRIRGGLPDIGTPARLHIYWHMRIKSGTQAGDVGGSVGGAVDAVVRMGYCPEAMWDYVPANLFQAPTNAADVEARRHRIGTPWAPRTLSDIKEALGRNQPVAFGLRLYNSFFQADLNGGVVPMPDQAAPSKKHAGLLVGFDDDSQRLVMRNSWGLHTASGRPCGDGGHYYLPYAYVGGELSMDFWAIPSLSG